MASSKKTIEKKIYNGITPFFFRDTEQQRGVVKKTNLLERFESINRFYSSIEEDDTNYKMNIKDCYALKLAGAIIDRISSGDVRTDKEGSLKDGFYSDLAASLQEDRVRGDDELTVIYLKQMMNIMKSCGLVSIDKRKALISEDIQIKEKLYFKLLKSLWDETDWKAIFPSSPETAEKLFRQREIFLGFLEEFYTKVSVEDFANDFYEMTGIAQQNDFFMISFLDFYLLTWFRHFGIIDYISSDNSEVVHIMLNDFGREIIKVLG
ncbi:MAG TPA: hypothetical protein PK358_06280 [Spirochaetota bacterium]|nr:hypothetical protein [Spirochaetota bacterium]HPJ34423.1 hypothetical protein [Spirochaetota bacterium]